MSGFVFLILVTRFVDPSTYGLFTLGLTVTLLMQGLSDLGLDRSVDYFIPRNIGDPSTVRSIIVNAIGLVFLGSTTTAVFLFMTAPWLAGLFNEPGLETAIRMLAISLPLWGVLNVTVGVFRGIKQLQYLVASKDIIRQVTKVVGTTTLLAAGLGLTGLIGGYLVSLVVALVVAVGFFPQVSDKLFVQEEVEETVGNGVFSVRNMLSYSLPLAISGIIYTIIFQLDYLVIGYYHTSAEVALYRVTYLLTSAMVVVVGPLAQAYKPVVAERTGDTASLRDLYRLTTRWTTLMAIPIWLTIALAPTAYLQVLFTTEYAVGGLVVGVLAAGFLANAVAGPEAMMLEGLGYPRLTMVNSLLLIAVNLVLDVYLIPRYGVLGAAVATSAALTVRVLAGVLEIYLLRDIHPYGRWLLDVSGAVIPTALVGWATATVLPSDRLVAFCLPPLVLATYLSALAAAGLFDENDAKVARRVDDYLGHQLLQRIVRT